MTVDWVDVPYDALALGALTDNGHPNALLALDASTSLAGVHGRSTLLALVREGLRRAWTQAQQEARVLSATDECCAILSLYTSPSPKIVYSSELREVGELATAHAVHELARVDFHDFMHRISSAAEVLAMLPHVYKLRISIMQHKS
jgi:hypothetical protein